jgi:NAD(P)-dependent dehydrogenase (short-subunit alcohol dehydrogenase family)
VVAQSPGRVNTVNLVVGDPTNIATVMATVKNTLGDQGLDVLINNAAVAYSTPSKMMDTTSP